MRLRTRARVGTAVLLTLLALSVLVPNLPGARPPGEDAGVFLYAGERILEGGLPYRDVWDHKPPAIHFLAALGLLVGQGSPIGFWALELGGLVLAALAGCSALARAFGAPAAVFASAAWLLAAPRLFLSDEGVFMSQAELFALPCQVAALALFVRPRSAGGDVAIGVLGGSAFLLKPTVIALWLVIGLLRLVGRDVRGLGAIALGGALPLALATAFFAARGGLGDLWDQAVVYNLANAATATAGARVEAAQLGLRLTAPSGLVLLAAIGWPIAAWSLRRPTLDPATRGLLAVAVVAAPLEVLFASGTGRAYHHYYLPWLASFAVLVAAAGRELTARLAPRPAGAVIAVVLLLMSVRPAMLLARVAQVPPDPAPAEAAAYVRASAAEGERVLVWGSRASINFLSGREAPTREVYQYGPLFTVGYGDGAKVRSFLAGLRRAPPSLIVDTSGVSFATPPLDVAASSGWRTPDERYVPPPEVVEVQAFVAEHYELTHRLASGWPVYRLRR